MTKYLLDTNIILRFSNPSDAQHELTTAAVATLLMQANECYLTAQILIELWVVATRPLDVNRLAMESATKLKWTLNVFYPVIVEIRLLKA